MVFTCGCRCPTGFGSTRAHQLQGKVFLIFRWGPLRLECGPGQVDRRATVPSSHKGLNGSAAQCPGVHAETMQSAALTTRVRQRCPGPAVCIHIEAGALMIRCSLERVCAWRAQACFTAASSHYLQRKPQRRPFPRIQPATRSESRHPV